VSLSAVVLKVFLKNLNSLYWEGLDR